VIGKVSGAIVLLKPASPGLEAAGISDILTKSLGSNNVLNVVYATMKALDQLKRPEDVADIRGKPLSDVLPFWERRKQRA